MIRIKCIKHIINNFGLLGRSLFVWRILLKCTFQRKFGTDRIEAETLTYLSNFNYFFQQNCTIGFQLSHKNTIR